MLREPPSSLEAEQQLLGAILSNPEAYHKVSGMLDAEHFHDARHGEIYSAVSKLATAGKNANVVTLSRLPGQDFGYLKSLLASTIGAFAAPDFAKLILDLYRRRQLIELGDRLASRAADSPTDENPDRMIEDLEIGLAALAGSRDKTDRLTNLTAAATLAIETTSAARRRDDRLAGLPTGFTDLDKKLGGLAPSDLIILAGRPSMGKSALAASIAYRAASRHLQGDGGCPVGFFTLEMSAEQLALRLIAEASGIPSFRLRRGDFTSEDFDHLLATAQESFCNPHMRIDESGRLNIDQLCSRARRMHRQFGVGLIVVDYLQLLSGAMRSRDSRHVEVSEITTGLKALAKDLNVPVLALSQLSREVEKRDDKRPQLADLRESGSIEQDADVVFFVYREEYYVAQHEPKIGAPGRLEWQDRMDKAKGKAELIIAKQRHGPTGTVEVSFEATLTKFGNLSRLVEAA